MCSVDPEDYLKTPQPLSIDDQACRQCLSQKAIIVLRRKDFYCKDCFLSISTHKFRSTLGKSKKMRPKDLVLVEFSGTQSATALLHLLYAGLHETNHRKFLFQIIVCFIDDSSVTNIDSNNSNTIESISNLLKQYEVQFVLTSIDEELEVEKMFRNVKSMTAREDLLAVARQKCLVNVARRMKCCKVLTCETANDLSIKLLSNVAQGRGVSLTSHVGFCDSRHEGVEILRPLREFTSKEVSYYCHFQNLHPLVLSTLTTKAEADISIQKLTETFITGLQEEFPSTVYTVYKIADKLAPQVRDMDDVCVLCDDLLVAQNSSAIQAIKFSKHVSQNGRGSSKDADCGETSKSSGCCSSNSDCCSSDGSRVKQLTHEDLELCLCYGCQLIVREIDSVERLPQKILKAAEERAVMKKMRSQIADFLL